MSLNDDYPGRRILSLEELNSTNPRSLTPKLDATSPVFSSDGMVSSFCFPSCKKTLCEHEAFAV